MFDQTHILRLLQLITRSHTRIQQRAFQCAQTLIETHQKLIVQIVSSGQDSPAFNEFKRSLETCENIMLKAIEDRQYTTTIASARFLYSLLRIILSHQVAYNAMDVDIPILPELKRMGQRVTHAITQVDLGLIQQNKYIQHSTKWKLKELLKIKANFCLLLNDWDSDATFKNAFELLKSTEGKKVRYFFKYETNKYLPKN